VEWRDVVKQHNIGHIKLGRLAPTLQALPTVIWHTPIDEYMDRTVAEIRALKTHGEKRVRVILEVFCVAYEALSEGGSSEEMAARLKPKFIAPLEAWIRGALQAPEAPSVAEVTRNFVMPLLNQLSIDAGSTIHRLAEERLGINGSPQSVRNQAKRLGITRARVYQLLEDGGKIMEVRWPEGEGLVRQLAAKITSEVTDKGSLKQFNDTVELFYPSKSAATEENESNE